MRVDLKDIKRVVCDFYELEEKLLFAKSRMRHIIAPRQAFTYLAYNINKDIGYNSLAKYMGCNHATLVCSNKRVQGFMDIDPTYRQEIKDLWSSCLFFCKPDNKDELDRLLVQNLIDKLLHCKSNTELKEILTSTKKKI
tara:strand:- start:28 stop:444 length:417 start_codon:yes stop_codon:yes gene_type:complete